MGPSRTRTSLSTGWPTRLAQAAHEVPPSLAHGRSRATSWCGSALQHVARASGTVEPVVEAHAAAQPSERRGRPACRAPSRGRRARTWRRGCIRPAASAPSLVSSSSPLRLQVEPADRIDPLADAPRTSSRTVGRPSGSASVLTTPRGLCSTIVRRRGRRPMRSPSTMITSRAGSARVPSSRTTTPLTLTRPVADQRLGGAPRRDAGGAQDLLQPLAPVGYAVRGSGGRRRRRPRRRSPSSRPPVGTAAGRPSGRARPAPRRRRRARASGGSACRSGRPNTSRNSLRRAVEERTARRLLPADDADQAALEQASPARRRHRRRGSPRSRGACRAGGRRRSRASRASAATAAAAARRGGGAPSGACSGGVRSW